MIYKSCFVLLCKTLIMLGLILPPRWKKLISFVNRALLISLSLCEIISSKILPFISPHHILACHCLRYLQSLEIRVAFAIENISLR